MLDKPVVTFNGQVPSDHVIGVTDCSALGAALEKAIQRPDDLMQAARRFTDRMHPYRDGRSSERVLDATETFIRDIAPTLKRKPLNLLRKFKARRRLGYWRPS